jgi:hypothetical protein
VLGVKAKPVSPVARFPRASLDASARLRLSASMIFVERAGLAAGFARQRSWKRNAASERRSHRGAGEAKRSSRAAA